MDTASFQFVAFGLVVALLSNVHRSRLWRSAVLLLASAIFLGLLARGPMVLLPLFGFLLIGYVGLVLLERGWSRTAISSILTVLFVYIWLKRYTFLPDQMLLHSVYFTLGLSYIFFRVLHLLIEARDSNEKRHVGPVVYLLYTLNFTTFITGPVQPYDDFARDQFADDPIALGARVVGLQLERIVRGFFKVNVLAMLLDMLRVDALAQLTQPLGPSLKLFAAFRLACIYPLFLYCNFSGYIDIVIALARLMRVRLPENFDRPFSASSYIDFWSRWHMSLSNWFRSYVYNPLLVMLMRRIATPYLQPFLAVFCFFVTFFLVGLWHGRTSEFLMFGILQGGGIATNKLWQLGLTGFLGRKPYKALANHPVYVLVGRGLTFIWFSFTVFWFWADWTQLDTMRRAIGTWNWIAVWGCVWLAASGLLALWEWLRAAMLSVGRTWGSAFASRYARVVYASALGVTAFVLTILLNQPAPGIVYKAF